MGNKYIGSFQETPFAPLDLPFTRSALREILKCTVSPPSPYTHQQIYDWVQRLVLAVREEKYQDYEPFSVEDQRAAELEIAEDMGAQWDMFLYNSYTLAELQSLDFAGVVLPHEWFKEWLRKLEKVPAQGAYLDEASPGRESESDP